MKTRHHLIGVLVVAAGMMFLSACGGDNDNNGTPAPTATNTTAPTSTKTTAPPTATNTTAPPTATNTPVPPTATNTEGPTNTPGGETPTPTMEVPTATPTTGQAVCGNGVQEGDEQCDDGGICVGGANDGAKCPANVEGGVDCGEGITCQPVGGDGCAANCTNETRRTCTFKACPEMMGPNCNDSTIGTGAVVHTQVFPVPLSFTGNQTLTTGTVRASDPDQIIPVVVKPEDVHFDPVVVPGLVCACVRAIAAPALFNNSGVGKVGCSANGLPDVDYLYSIDHRIGEVGGGGFTEQDCTDAGGTVEDGTAAHPHQGVCNGPAVVTYSGQGPMGSSLIESNTAISLISDGGACITDGSGDTSLYGPDGSACTDDDPNQAEPSTLTTTSGTVMAQVLHANNSASAVIGPYSFSGSTFDCAAGLADPTGGLSGSANVSAFGTLDADTIRDNVTTSVFVCQ